MQSLPFTGVQELHFYYVNGQRSQPLLPAGLLGQLQKAHAQAILVADASAASQASLTPVSHAYSAALRQWAINHQAILVGFPHGVVESIAAPSSRHGQKQLAASLNRALDGQKQPVGAEHWWIGAQPHEQNIVYALTNDKNGPHKRRAQTIQEESLPERLAYLYSQVIFPAKDSSTASLEFIEHPAPVIA